MTLALKTGASAREGDFGTRLLRLSGPGARTLGRPDEMEETRIEIARRQTLREAEKAVFESSSLKIERMPSELSSSKLSSITSSASSVITHCGLDSSSRAQATR